MSATSVCHLLLGRQVCREADEESQEPPVAPGEAVRAPPAATVKWVPKLKPEATASVSCDALAIDRSDLICETLDRNQRHRDELHTHQRKPADRFLAKLDLKEVV